MGHHSVTPALLIREVQALLLIRSRCWQLGTDRFGTFTVAKHAFPVVAKRLAVGVALAEFLVQESSLAHDNWRRSLSPVKLRARVGPQTLAAYPGRPSPHHQSNVDVRGYFDQRELAFPKGSLHNSFGGSHFSQHKTKHRYCRALG